ncbi:MAG: L-rhamnose mutarotase [Paraglaciecola sp.]|jgi:L-rhamnose mutarotase
MTIRHCFALDLKDDPHLIAEYKKFHSPGEVWPEVVDSIKGAGIECLNIYLVGNRLFMVMDINEIFSFTAKAEIDLTNEKVVAWENLMSTFQQKLPWASDNEKWVLMENIFTL